jgi:hypothetical protein
MISMRTEAPPTRGAVHDMAHLICTCGWQRTTTTRDQAEAAAAVHAVLHRVPPRLAR